MSEEQLPNKSRHRRSPIAETWRRWTDGLARVIIKAGGIGTILVAMLIVVVMISNLLPLVEKCELEPCGTISLVQEGTSHQPRPIGLGIDEYGDLCWVAGEDRTIRVYSIHDGQLIETHAPDDSSSCRATCISIAEDDSTLLFGCDDGSVQPVSIEFATEYIEVVDCNSPSKLGHTSLTEDRKVLTPLRNGLVRVQSIRSVTFHTIEKLFDNSVICVDWKTPESVFGLEKIKSWSWAATDGQSIKFRNLRRRRLGLSQQASEERQEWMIKKNGSAVIGLMVDAQEDRVTSVDEQGLVEVWEGDTNDLLVSKAMHWSIAGSHDRVSACSPLVGRNTLLLGCESGHVEAVSLARNGKRPELYSIHRFTSDATPVCRVESASNQRIALVCHESGQSYLFFIPTRRKLIAWQTSHELGAFFSANSRIIGTMDASKIELLRLTTRFPEASFQSFFGANWYEGYNQPKHIWQSSPGTSKGEPKFGIMPLIFGTLKATLFSMLIAGPIGLFAATFSSEFLSLKARKRIKPMIELMSSVPSVALGFVGAMVLAPLLRDHLFQMLASIPLSLIVLFAFRNLWDLVPKARRGFQRRLRIPLCFLSIVLGFVVSSFVASPLERFLFSGSMRQWLSGEVGRGWIGWALLLLLPCGLLVLILVSRMSVRFSRWIPDSRLTHSPTSQRLIECLMVVVVTCGLTIVLATILYGLGWDPRGSFFGAYQERNALLVGLILGFAIVPLIYSLSEDALQSVPQHLRSASMSCGATTWQTTIRIVIPTAMSGLFGALMLGLGRAIGETMVVLMAAGNTPLMEWNPFSGYRTLSATLAIELPEAARGSTHYHTLFVTAFVLFCMTILVNSLAELIRLHFRKRAHQL